MHVTPVLDALWVREIPGHTQTDATSAKLKDLIFHCKTYIPKNLAELQLFRNIFSEITVPNNGTLLKQDQIVLLAYLIKKALSFSHVQNGLIRRLTTHFYIKGIDKIVEEFINKCKFSQLFTQKTTKHPMAPSRVPERCWHKTSVDLFGSLPSKNHIVVIQDLTSRYPVAKVVRSTNMKSVIPVLDDTYNTFDNPQCQKNDDGPPFDSKEMLNFVSKRDIKQVKTPSGYPSANNVETVMKPLGKAIKIGHLQNKNEAETLNSFIINYRDTPHLSTGVVPAHMLLRDGYRFNLSHKSFLHEIQIIA